MISSTKINIKYFNNISKYNKDKALICDNNIKYTQFSEIVLLKSKGT